MKSECPKLLKEAIESIETSENNTESDFKACGFALLLVNGVLNWTDLNILLAVYLKFDAKEKNYVSF